MHAQGPCAQGFFAALATKAKVFTQHLQGHLDRAWQTVYRFSRLWHEPRIHKFLYLCNFGCTKQVSGNLCSALLPRALERQRCLGLIDDDGIDCIRLFLTHVEKPDLANLTLNAEKAGSAEDAVKDFP